MAAPGAVEERGLVDDVRTRGHGRLGLGGRRPELFAAVLDGAVERDLDHATGPAALSSPR